jgi:hypothetical protein
VRKGDRLLELLAKNSTEPEVFQRILQFEFRRHQTHDIADIFHDDLGECYRPFYFHEFADLLNKNDLQFLSEAELHASSRQGVAAEYNELLDSLDIRSNASSILICSAAEYLADTFLPFPSTARSRTKTGAS